MKTVRPLGKITTVDSASLDALYPSGNGIGILTSKEILRATTVKIDNQSDAPIVARVIEVNAIDASSGEANNVTQQNNVEVFNYYDLIIKPLETVYVAKRATATVLDNPTTPTYVVETSGETIQLRLAEHQTAGNHNGFIYASPVTIEG
jgi:hypothetical protein